MPPAAILDIDGTLVDTNHQHAIAWYLAFRQQEWCCRSGASTATSAPEPDLVLAALDKLGTRDAVMVGDTPWDVKAAGRANVPTVAVLTGAFSADELSDAGAAVVFESIVELRERIGETPLG